MTRMAKGKKAKDRQRLSEKVAELQATGGATTTGTTTNAGDNLSDFTAIEFLERVIRDAEERRVFERVASVYDDLVDVGDSTLEIPRTTGHLDLTDQQSVEGEDRTYQQLENLDTIETTITADSFVSGGIEISKQAMMTTNIDLVEEARNAVTQQIAEDVDLAIRDEIVDATPAANVVDQTGSGELTPEAIADAMENVERNNYTPRFLIVSPAQINDLRKDSQFTNASEYGDDEVVMEGEIGQYLGVSVMKTQAAVRDDAGDEFAYLVGEGPDGRAVGPLLAYKELPNMDMQYNREENAQRIYYDHAFETNTVQPDALSLIQTKA
jgi:N4-gp56 family major capsid protein